MHRLRPAVCEMEVLSGFAISLSIVRSDLGVNWLIVAMC